MNASSTQSVDFVERLVNNLENMFPPLKEFLSWENELADLGPLVPEWC
jgi:hypothetical protein